MTRLTTKFAVSVALAGSLLAPVAADARAVQAPTYAAFVALAERCESVGEGWAANTGNGYYGGLQFDMKSWHWVGGKNRPDRASKSEQIHRAQILFKKRGGGVTGWKAWPVCSRKLHYR